MFFKSKEASQFQGCFEEIFKGVSRKFQDKFQGVSKRFMLHGTHRSFPSRRRACLSTNDRRAAFVMTDPLEVLGRI